MRIFSDDDDNQDDNSVDSAPASTKPATSEATSPSSSQQNKDGAEQPASSATDVDVKKEADEDVMKTPAKRETRAAREAKVSASCINYV